MAGGPAESIFQPEWSPDGVLHFISDRSGWWNLYRLPGGDVPAECLYAMDADFGMAQWVLARGHMPSNHRAASFAPIRATAGPWRGWTRPRAR